MSEVSDKLRKDAIFLRANKLCVPLVADDVESIADRIDAEMVELPRDKDGVVFNIGDTVYDGCGIAYDVAAMMFQKSGDVCKWKVIDEAGLQFEPLMFSHERLDSLERIISDMSAEIESMESSITASDDALDALRDYMERIKVLAEKEGGRR